MLRLLTREYNEKTPYEIPLNADSLSKLNSQLQVNQISISNIDVSMLCGALQSYKDCITCLPFSGLGREYAIRDPFLVQFVERQRQFLTTVIGEQADRSGVLGVIVKHLKFFESYDFSKNEDFLQVESVLLAEMEISPDHMKTMANIVEERKSFLIERISNTDKSSIRSILSSDPLNWSAFGQGIVGANLGALAIPEPLVTKGIAVASTFFGLALCLIPSD